MSSLQPVAFQVPPYQANALGMGSSFSNNSALFSPYALSLQGFSNPQPLMSVPVPAPTLAQTNAPAALPFEQTMRTAVQKTAKIVGINAIPEFHNPLEKGVLRILGFCNEFAEAAKHVIPAPLFKMLYGVEAVYTAADTWNTRKHAMNHQDASLPYELKKSVGGAEALTTLIKQGLATFIIPTFVINKVHDFVHHLLSQPKLLKNVPTSMAKSLTSAAGKKYAPMMAGLATIPLLTTFADPAVFKLCDTFVRPFVGAAPLVSGD
ncbi:MAG: hypothetical protein VKK59_05875 [Vampirovibrionales bacterium]|nr:hypothetical protein [Vampirovibrionales bacterium]